MSVVSDTTFRQDQYRPSHGHKLKLLSLLSRPKRMRWRKKHLRMLSRLMACSHLFRSEGTLLFQSDRVRRNLGLRLCHAVDAPQCRTPLPLPLRRKSSRDVASSYWPKSVLPTYPSCLTCARLGKSRCSFYSWMLFYLLLWEPWTLPCLLARLGKSRCSFYSWMFFYSLLWMPWTLPCLLYLVAPSWACLAYVAWSYQEASGPKVILA